MNRDRNNGPPGKVSLCGMSNIKDKIRGIWKERVTGRFVYRGMDKADLVFPLNPENRPFEQNKGMILSFFNIVEEILDTGHTFEVVEEHFGNRCVHDPRNLVKWSRRDLELKGIDFTSNYNSAREYSDCWQGSQLKQNIKSMSAHLLKSRKVAPEKLGVVHAISEWVNTPRPSKPVVLHVRLDLDVFDVPSKPPEESREFYCRLVKPLERKDVYKIEEL